MFDHDALRPHVSTLCAPAFTAVAVAAALAATAAPAGAQEAHRHSHQEQEAHAREGLHFSHPLVAESPTPDTKIRLDYRFFDYPEGTDENSAELEAEYAFSRVFSVEAGLPYTFNGATFGNVSVLFKFSNYAFEESGVLLGYGLGLSAPTNGAPETGGGGHAASVRSEASRIRPEGRSRPTREGPTAGEPLLHTSGGGGVVPTLGTQTWELQPYLNVALAQGAWELAGWGLLGVPFNQEHQHEVQTSITYQLSTLYHVSDRLQAVLELDGRGGISGEAVGSDVLNLSPGVKFAPLAGQPLFVGVSAGFPLVSGVEENPFDARIKTSLFWHF